MTARTETDRAEALNLHALENVALAATGRQWRWQQYSYGAPDLVATVGDPDVYVYETEVIEITHTGGCGCRASCELEVSLTPHDAEFIAATGPDVVLALIRRIRELEDTSV